MRIGLRSKLRVGTLIILLALAVGTKESVGQNVGGTPVPATPALDSSWPSVNLNVLVLDKEGVPEKVDEGEFRLLEDRTERPLQVLGSPDSPVSLVLMIDSSGSVFKRKDAIITAVKTIVKGLPDGSEVAAILFNEKAYLDLPFTPVSKVDFSFLDRFRAVGPTALYDAVVATEDHVIAHAKFERRALVILSDGEDNASHVSIGLAYGKMEQSGAPMVYLCPVSEANVFQSQKMVGLINMRFLAKRSGGPEFSLDPDPLSAATRIADAIRNQYVLQFTATNTARDGKARKIAVRLSVKQVNIYALPAYFAPAK
ncbi:MAG: VWA domain-containing protein [Terracidiphilus sp.]